jgi:hypothetical protein
LNGERVKDLCPFLKAITIAAFQDDGTLTRILKADSFFECGGRYFSHERVPKNE